MKNKKVNVTIIFICICVILLSGCAPFGSDSNDSSPSDGSEIPENVYSSLISLLENEIQQLRDEQSISAAEYEKKLRELESLLASSTSDPKDDTTGEATPQSPFTYTVSDGKATVTGYSGSYSVLVVPEELDGYTVAEIADSVFAGDTKLSSVSLPSTLEKIGWFAFSGCTSLKSITVPMSVKEIGYDTFAYCTKLTVYCSKGSYAEKYAESYGISCVAN